MSKYKAKIWTKDGVLTDYTEALYTSIAQNKLSRIYGVSPDKIQCIQLDQKSEENSENDSHFSFWAIPISIGIWICISYWWILFLIFGIYCILKWYYSES
jgi:hypothetical protein